MQEFSLYIYSLIFLSICQMFFEKILWKFSGKVTFEQFVRVKLALRGFWLACSCDFGVSAKPWRFRRRRTAEIARAKPRPFEAGRSWLRPLLPRFTVWYSLLFTRSWRFFGHRTRKIARVQSRPLKRDGRDCTRIFAGSVPRNILCCLRALLQFRRRRAAEIARFCKTSFSKNAWGTPLGVFPKPFSSRGGKLFVFRNAKGVSPLEPP